MERLITRVIYCDHPGCTESFELAAGDTVYLVRHHARRVGWSFVSPKSNFGGDYCPYHTTAAASA